MPNVLAKSGVPLVEGRLLHELMAPVECMRLSMIQCIVLRHTRQEEVTSRFVQQPEEWRKYLHQEERPFHPEPSTRTMTPRLACILIPPELRIAQHPRKNAKESLIDNGMSE